MEGDGRAAEVGGLSSTVIVMVLVEGNFFVEYTVLVEVKVVNEAVCVKVTVSTAVVTVGVELKVIVVSDISDKKIDSISLKSRLYISKRYPTRWAAITPQPYSTVYGTRYRDRDGSPEDPGPGLTWP